MTVSYDANGNLVSRTDEDGYVTNYVFDARNLIESIAYADGRSVNFTYNERGELVHMVDWTGTTSISLDLLGRITSVNDSNNRVVSYTYDGVGNQTSITYPDNSVVQYVYDRLNRLTSVIGPENAVTSYVYDRAGRLTSLNYPNDRSESYTYDAIGQLLKTIETVNGQDSILYQYSYDPVGNIISEFKRDSSIDPMPEIAINTFNERNQLTTKTILDELGATVDVFTYLYDNRGNLVSVTDSSYNTTKTYLFDATNWMVLGTNADGETSAYLYNALGFLVNNTTTTVNGITSTDYVIDYASPYQSVLAKYEVGGLIYKNVFGLDRISTAVINELEPANSLMAFIQNDRLGSGRYASNALGEIIGFTDMDVWGNVVEKVLPVIGETQVDILNNFTNHEFDEVLGVYYAKARFYDPVSARMISEDPIKDGLNWYMYVYNNPLKYTDPSGLYAVPLREWFDDQLQFITARFDETSGRLEWDDRLQVVFISMSANGQTVSGYFRAGICDAYIEDDRMYVDRALLMNAFRQVYQPPAVVSSPREVVAGILETIPLTNYLQAAIGRDLATGNFLDTEQRLERLNSALEQSTEALIYANVMGSVRTTGPVVRPPGTGSTGSVFGGDTQWTATRPRGTHQTYRVTQRNDINWNQVRTAGDARFIGKTNAEAAARGLPPQLPDGNFATLHHLGQDSRGPLVEASTRYHGVGKYGQDILHSVYGRSTPNPRFPINRRAFGVDTREYWRWRVLNP